MSASSSATSPPEVEGADSPVAPPHKRPRSSNEDVDGPARDPIDNSGVPKPKRLACMICRRRKLKCDGVKPSCSTCSRLGHPCAYDEVRRKSGPKRGYVKALEERLKQVETLLKDQAAPLANTAPEPAKASTAPLDNTNGRRKPGVTSAPPPFPAPPVVSGPGERESNPWQLNTESPKAANVDDFGFNPNMNPNMPMNMAGNFTWEMIGLGLEEPLPPQDTIDELHQIYFEKVHPSVPMIHRYRYLAAMNLAPNQRPPVCLRYAIWTLACSITDKYSDLKDLFYQRARKYVEADYIKGYGEHMISVAHAQTHVLLASYEFKMMYFPRGWANTGAAVRLCQMIGLHRLDGTGLDVKQCLPPPRDWTEREERRRTFWMAFCEDRYASIGTGWPMTVDERDIMTNLPSSEEAFDMSQQEQTQSLSEAMTPSGASKLSPFGGIVLMACLFGRNLIHLHRPDPNDRDNDLNGEFWKRHRQMDHILLNTSLCLPSSLKLPAGITNPNIVFTNMSIHTSTICLHQAAIFKADRNKLPASVSSESKVRCITAANEIGSIMRTISHLDLSSMNPFISFCLYVAARVFVQYLKSRPDDGQTADSLRFLLSAMNALKRRNPLTESFLVQLDVDLEALGMKIPKLRTAFPRSSDSPGPVSFAPSNSAVQNCGQQENVSGILAYHNECHFLRTVEDDANPANAPDIVEPEREPANASATTSPTDGTATTSGTADMSFSRNGWLSPEQGLARHDASPSRSMQSIALTPGSGGMYDKPQGVGTGVPGYGPSDNSTESNDMSVSPDGDQSSRPTPNSSATSDHRPHLGANAMGGSGPNSFDDGSGTNHQNMVPTQAGQGPYYPDPNTFGMPTAPVAGGARFQVPPQGPMNDYMPPNSWGEMPPQPGMTPLAEGVLRTLINMGPMDAMDLSSWNAGN